MGGNALKNTVTERKSAEEYNRITNDVIEKLKSIFPDTHMVATLSFRNKESFGDSDILITSDNLPSCWQELIVEVFKPNETYSNGSAFSFDYQSMQIDLIKSPLEEFHFSNVYYAYNDLGNFIGRIAHRMGYRYGHAGLRKLVREDTKVIADILVSRDPRKVFEFLGYDFDVWMKGFDTLEEIFAYAASSPYFNREVFDLDNNNHENRTRDRKRPNYSAFLKWMEDKPELDVYQWQPYTGDVRSPQRDEEKRFFQELGFITFDGFEHQYDRAMRQEERRKSIKEKWNGDIVGQISGLKGKDLGVLITACKLQKNTQAWSEEGFEDWVLEATQEEIKDFILIQALMLRNSTYQFVNK